MTRRAQAGGAAAALLVVAACTASEPLLEPVVESPAAGAPAYPWDDLTSVVLAVTSDGAQVASATATRDQPARIDGIPFGDDLVVHLSGMRGDAEAAYGRTCSVSWARGETAPAPHLFFARIARWAAAPAPARPERSAAYTLPDGSALFFGGAAEDTVERFDPVAGAFATLADRVAPRAGAVVAALADGRALRIGGEVDGVPVEDFELVSPTAAAGSQIVAVPDARLRLVGHAAATLTDGTVVLLGGELTESGATATTGVTWLFTPEAERPRRLAARLATPRRDHTVTRLGNEVGAALLIVGGRDAGGVPVAAAEIYDPLTEGFDVLSPLMVVPRHGHRAVRLPDGRVLILGGRDAAGPVTTVEVYRPLSGQFRAAGELPAGAGLVGGSVTVLPDGRVLVAGGRDASGAAVATTLIARLDPIDGNVRFGPTAPLAAPRADHAAALLCDGTVLVAGGGAAGAERYNPPSAGRR